MRKFIIAILLLCCFFVFIGCAEKEDDSLENVSLLQQSLYCGEDDNFIVEMMSVISENPFCKDGKTGKKEEFVKIKVAPREELSGDITFDITIGDVKYSGKLSRDKVGRSLTAKITAKELDADNYKIVITNGETVSEIELLPAFSGGISYRAALELVNNEMSGEIDKLKSQGDYETHIKIVKGNGENEYNWYISFLNESERVSALVSMKENKVISKRG